MPAAERLLTMQTTIHARSRVDYVVIARARLRAPGVSMSLGCTIVKCEHVTVIATVLTVSWPVAGRNEQAYIGGHSIDLQARCDAPIRIVTSSRWSNCSLRNIVG